MAEPRFVRIERPSRQALVVFCPRCDRPIDRVRKQWCSPACIEYARRWRRALEDYWKGQEEHATATG